MKFVKPILMVLITIVLSFLVSVLFGRLYSYLFPSIGGGFFIMSKDAADQIIGLPLAYIFFLTLLFTAFGDAKKYWWIGIALVPAIIFEAAFDAAHIYFPILLALVAWLLGKAISLAVLSLSSRRGARGEVNSSSKSL